MPTIVTLLVVEEQELEIVQRNTFVPNPTFLTAVVGEEPLTKVPLPLTTDQVPVPTTGAFALSIAESQTVWFVPAIEVVGGRTRVIMTSSVVGVQVPLDMVQRNVLLPAPNPVTVEVGLDALVIVPVPVTRLHKPVPAEGAFPAKVAEVEQTL